MKKVIALAKKHKPTVLVVACMLTYTVGAFPLLLCIVIYTSGIFAGMITDMPRKPLSDLQCPLTPLQGNQVIATAENPYDETHRYTFYFDLSTTDGQEPSQERIADCDQEIEIPPHQKADATCTIIPPDPGTDLVTVIVWAYSDVELSGPGAYESYIGQCTFPTSAPRLLWRLELFLVATVASLAGLPWVTISWPTLDTNSRSRLIAFGLPLLITWSYLVVLFLVLIKGF